MMAEVTGADVGIGAKITQVQKLFAPMFGATDVSADGHEFDVLWEDGAMAADHSELAAEWRYPQLNDYLDIDAGVPVVQGERWTKVQMVAYTLLLVPLTLMPSLFGAMGLFYLAAALALGG